MLDCLQNLVGLSDKSCDCYNGTKPADFDDLNVSETGYYLTDEDNGLPMLDSIYAGIDCGDANNIWSVLQRARNFAINGIYTDLQAAILQQYDRTVDAFSGQIGQRKSSSYRNIAQAYAGHLFQPVNIKDASFVLTHIWLGANTTGDVEISFSSNDPDFSAASQTVTIATAGVFQKFDITNVVFPLWSKNVQYDSCTDCSLRYAISYPVASGFKPMDNAFSCCGANHKWKRYASVGGFQTDDLEALVDNCGYNCNNSANGMILEGYFTCDNLQWLCELEELGGYDIRDVLARTMQFKATVYLTNHILNSTEINYWTTLNREALYGKRNHADKRYKDNIMWMAANMPNNATGCYKCKPGWMGKRSF